MRIELERQFEEQALAVYENGKKHLNYRASRFLQKIRSDGGVAAAKAWLRPKKDDKPTNGFLRLVEHGRLDLSLEAVVLNERWGALFSEVELAVARQRLAKYGYFEIAADHRDRDDMLPQEVAVGELFLEGAVRSVLVNQYERNSAARSACIDHYGPQCYVCGFDFGNAYGSAFSRCIHVHHLCPLSSIGNSYQVDPVADLRPICPNCHAVVHKRDPCYTIAEARTLIRKA